MLIFNNLAIFSEILTNGYQPVALDIIALLSILSGIFVIITVNPIVSVLFLISLFVNIACYLILIGVHFLGLAYLLVYVGGVSILFLFTIMLINIRTSEIYQNSTESIPLGFIVSIAFFYPVSSILPSSKIGYIDSEINNVFLVSSNKWDTALSHVSDISSVGNLLYSSHAIWLILTGIILLMAMIGAIAITVNQEKKNRSYGFR